MKIEGTELVRDEGYARLLSRVRGQIQTGRERLKQLADLEALRLYWQIGESVGRFLKTVDQPYGRKVVARLATDIEMSPSVLYDAIRFRELFLKFPARGILTWTHYRQLMGVMTREGRDYYLDEAEREGWSVRELEARIKESFFERSLGLRMESEPSPLLSPKRLQAKRGAPYVYRVIDKNGEGALDLGFRASQRLRDPFADLAVGSVVQSIPDARF